MQTQPCLYIIDDLGISHPVDLAKSEDIALTFCVNDIQSLVQTKSNFGKSVSLLGTERTNNTLGYVFRVDKVDRSILHKRMKAQLILGNIDIMKGVGILEIVDILFDPKTNTVEYDCDLTSQNYNWVPLLKALSFCDADLGTHTFNDTTARNSWDRTGKNGTPYPYDYIGCTYFPVHYGWWYNKREVSIFDLRPHTYIKWLLERGFEAIGYKLTGEYTETEDFAKRVLIYGKGVFGATREEVDSLYRVFDIVPGSYFGSGEISTYLLAGPSVAGLWQSTTWVQPFDYSMGIAITFPAGTVFSTSVNPQIKIFIDDIVGAVGTYLGSGAEFHATYQGCISKGQKVRIKVIDSIIPPFPQQVDITEGAQITFTPLNFCNGGVVNLCETIDPSLNFVSILSGLAQAVGLMIFTDDESKTVQLVRMSEYYKTAPHEDWTSKLDCSSSLKQSVGNDCRNFKIAYAQDSSDLALEVECSRWGYEKFSALVVNDPDNSCVTEFRNPVFAPMESDGWQIRTEGGIHAAAFTQYGTGYNTYMLQDPDRTNNWSVDTWTQPYTLQMAVAINVAAGLTYGYHAWAIEVNGEVVSQLPYEGGSLKVEWFGCLHQGDEVKFKIIPDLLVTVTPADYLEVSNPADVFVTFSYRYARFNQVEDNPSTFKSIFLSAVKNRSDDSVDALDPKTIISHDIVPRMAVYEGLLDDVDLGWTETGGISWRYNPGTGMIPLPQHPYAYFIDYYNLTRQSLSFSDFTGTTVCPDNAGGLVPLTSRGVARTQYGLLLDALSTGVIIRLWVKLTPSDIQNLDFGTPKFFSGLGIGNTLYFLNKVLDWNPTSGRGLCELIQTGLPVTF